MYGHCAADPISAVLDVVQEKLQKDLEAVEAVDSELKEVLDAQAKEVGITRLDLVKRMMACAHAIICRYD